MAYCYDKYDVHVRTSRGYDFYSVVAERGDYQVYRLVGEIPDDTHEYFDRVGDNNIIVVAYSGLLDCLFPSVISTAFVEDIDLLPDNYLQELFVEFVRRQRELLDLRFRSSGDVEEFLDGYDLHKDASEKAAPEPEAVK
jgi:hypothetical protein